MPYRGDILLLETAVASTVATVWSWGLGVSIAQEVLNHTPD